MATLISRIEIVVKNCAFVEGEFSFIVRVPPAHVIDEIEKALNKGNDEFKYSKLLSNPKAISILMRHAGQGQQVDPQVLMSDPDFLSMIEGDLSSDLIEHMLKSHDDNALKTDIAKLIKDYCDEPMGFDEPVTWADLSAIADNLYMSAAKEVLSVARGKKAELQLKN